MKIFTKVKTIKSKAGELHFERWAIVECEKFSIYIHRIHKEDKDEDLHNHPWNFASLILKGSYVEEHLPFDYPEWWHCPIPTNTRLKKFFSFSKGDRGFYHKIKKIEKGPVWSLFFTWGKHEEWGYWVEKLGTYVDNEAYRFLKNNGKLEELKNKSNFVYTMQLMKIRDGGDKCLDN